nr:ammonia-dependent NAD(+) synthetase [uncultured Actinomyces sp.]
MTDRAQQQQIINELEVVRDFNAEREVEHRVGFLVDYLRRTGAAGYVLGISGGVDSSVGGRLTQLACERAREQGLPAWFVAMRLPYRVQHDEVDAQRALDFIRPDESITVNIGPATDAIWDELVANQGTAATGLTEFVKGNVKARQRMIAQYAVAGARGMLVVGTDQAAEAVVGFYTKYGDGGADVTPLAGLPKRRVRELATWLGAEPDLPLALVGDWNVAPRDEDVWDMSVFEGATHVSSPEREAFAAFAEAGMREVTRERVTNYTYWDYQKLRFPRNEGMRIDFVYASPALAGRVTGAAIDRDERKGKGASDHVPVIVEVD